MPVADVHLELLPQMMMMAMNDGVFRYMCLTYSNVSDSHVLHSIFTAYCLRYTNRNGIERERERERERKREL